MKFLRLLKRELAAEARSWIDEGFISEEQAARSRPGDERAYAVIAVSGSGRAALARLDLP